MTFRLLYITYKNLTEAKKISQELLKERLIACANFFPIKSMYWSEDKISENDEVVSILKTREENIEKITHLLKDIHPYETPCIIKLEATANDEFLKWIDVELNP